MVDFLLNRGVGGQPPDFQPDPKVQAREARARKREENKRLTEASKVWWKQHRLRLKDASEKPLPERPDPRDTPLGRALDPPGSGQALARFLGRPKETISRWKTGNSQPNLEDVPRISHALAILHEQGLTGPPPSIIEILYPLGFPEGCERSVAGNLAVATPLLIEDLLYLVETIPNCKDLRAGLKERLLRARGARRSEPLSEPAPTE